MLELVVLVGRGGAAGPGLERHERRVVCGGPDAQVVEAVEVDLHAVAGGADEPHGAAGHVLEHERVHVEQAVRQREGVGVFQELEAVLEVEQTGRRVDAWARVRPRLRKLEAVVGEGLALVGRDGDVERGVAAEHERQVGIAGVRDRKRLGESPVRGGIGHVELKVVREGLARRGGGAKAQRQRGVRAVQHVELAVAREAVAPQAHLAPLGVGAVVADVADDGEEHGRPARPPRGVALPQVLAPVLAQAHELRSLGIDREREAAGLARVQRHDSSFWHAAQGADGGSSRP